MELPKTVAQHPPLRKSEIQSTPEPERIIPRHGVITMFGYGIKVRVNRGHLILEDGIADECRACPSGVRTVVLSGCSTNLWRETARAATVAPSYYHHVCCRWNLPNPHRRKFSLATATTRGNTRTESLASQIGYEPTASMHQSISMNRSRQTVFEVGRVRKSLGQTSC